LLDGAGEELIQVILPRLAARAGVSHLATRIQTSLRADLEPLFAGAAKPEIEVSSSLTAGNYPVEIGAILDDGYPVGVKHTVDLFPDCGGAAGAKTTAAMLADARLRTGSRESWSDLDECLALVAAAALGGLRSIYLSRTHLSGSEPTTKIYLVGQPGALDQSVVEVVARAAATDVSVEPVLSAMTALGKNAVDSIGLAVNAGRVTGCKCYLVLPYLDFGLVKSLVHALDLSVGRALALARWFRLFIGPHWGRIGSVGVGLELRHRRADVGVEAYTFPTPHHIAKLAGAIDALCGPASTDRSGGSTAERLSQSWRDCDTTSMYLCGCGVEVGRFARLGRGTIYFGVAKGRESRTQSAAARFALQARPESPP